MYNILFGHVFGTIERFKELPFTIKNGEVDSFGTMGTLWVPDMDTINADEQMKCYYHTWYGEKKESNLYHLTNINNAMVRLLKDVSSYDTGREWADIKEIYEKNHYKERHLTVLSYELNCGAKELCQKMLDYWLEPIWSQKINPNVELIQIPEFKAWITNGESKIKRARENAVKYFVQVKGKAIGLTGEYSNANIALMILRGGENVGEVMDAVGHSLRFEAYPDIIIGLMDFSRTVQLRRGTDTFDLSKLARDWGGGGHAAASGAKVSTQLFLMLLGTYYEAYDKLQ